MEDQQIETIREVSITRVFDAPKELLFKAWSDPEHLKNWYAPKGCTLDIRTFDFKIGGEFHHCIVNPEYGDCWVMGVFDEIIPNRRIVSTMRFSNEAGDAIDALPAGKDPQWPDATITTVDFEDEAGKTKVTIHQNALEEVAKRTGAYQSWLQMLDRLTDKLTKG